MRLAKVEQKGCEGASACATGETDDETRGEEASAIQVSDVGTGKADDEATGEADDETRGEADAETRGEADGRTSEAFIPSSWPKVYAAMLAGKEGDESDDEMSPLTTQVDPGMMAGFAGLNLENMAMDKLHEVDMEGDDPDNSDEDSDNGMPTLTEVGDESASDAKVTAQVVATEEQDLATRPWRLFAA